MDVKKKKIIKTILIIVVMMIFLLLCWLFLGGKSFAKYQKEIDSNHSLEIAKPVFVMDGADNIKIDGVEDTVYHFSVKNFDDSEISEVDMKYAIQIVNNTEADLEFILTKDGESIQLEGNKTNFISLSSLTKQEDHYELKIKYLNHSATNEDINGNVQIKVEAVQVEK